MAITPDSMATSSQARVSAREKVRLELSQLEDDDVTSVILDVLRNRNDIVLPVVGGACPHITYAPASIINHRRMVGRIKSFNANNGYGFVACKELHDQFGCDVFVHKVQFTGFAVGQEVNFAVFLNKDKRPQAFDLIPLNGQMLAPPGALGKEAGASSSWSSSDWPCHDVEQSKSQQASASAISSCIWRPGGLFSSPSNPPNLQRSQQIPLPPPYWNAPPALSMDCPSMGVRNAPMSNLYRREHHLRNEFRRVMQGCFNEERRPEGRTNSSISEDEGLSYRRFRGRVKSLKSDYFGFIECIELKERFGRDVFVQPSQLEDCKVGAAVTFEVILNDKRQPQAHKIKLCGLQPSMDDGTITSTGNTDKQIDDVFEGTLCIICQEILHRSTSVQPCLHTFCSACLGGWLSRGDPGSRACPICRIPVLAVTRNHTLDGLIAGLLKAHPGRQRAAQDIQELNERDILHVNGYDLELLIEDQVWLRSRNRSIRLPDDYDYDDETGSDDSEFNPWRNLS